MNDPCNGQAGQYVSCIKINGVPLLPPLLSKECRKEMQYYKLLAKEVENRISMLTLLVPDEIEDIEDSLKDTNTDKSTNEILKQDIAADLDKVIDQGVTVTPDLPLVSHSQTDQVALKESSNVPNSPKKAVIDPTTYETSKDTADIMKITQLPDFPEHDCEYTKSDKDKGFDLAVEQIVYYNRVSDRFNEIFPNSNGPCIMAARSFHGSLVDLHKEGAKVLNKNHTMVRQRSYTVLKPSPQLIAHLDQFAATGVDIGSLSMTESQTNISSAKRRKNWDLQNAKCKWSSMAEELDKKTMLKKPSIKQTFTSPISSTKPSTPAPEKTNVKDIKELPKSEPLPKVRKARSPVRKPIPKPDLQPGNIDDKTSTPKAPRDYKPINNSWNTTKSLTDPKIPPTLNIYRRTRQTPNKDVKKPEMTVATPVDPVSCVRELYERIRTQQAIQMTNLIEKQKKEQLLLKQVFEEQNCILFNQLKSICPTSPIEAKEAWSDNNQTKSPASLKQANKAKSNVDTLSVSGDRKHSNLQSLKRDRSRSTKSSKGSTINSATRTNTPNKTTHSSPRRRIVYDSSSSEIDQDILTDRTGDTFADLHNVTFSSDESRDKRNVVPKKFAVGKNGGSRAGRNSVISREPTPEEREAATKIVAHAKGYLTRRLMSTEKVQSTVLTIRDALICALQLHQDHEGIRGADVDLHRRLIQQITAACYALHDTLVASTPEQRCAVIAADRAKKLARFSRDTPSPRSRAILHARDRQQNLT